MSSAKTGGAMEFAHDPSRGHGELCENIVCFASFHGPARCLLSVGDWLNNLFTGFYATAAGYSSAAYSMSAAR